MMKNDTNFLQIFKEEAKDLLEKIQHAYKNWDGSYTDKEQLSSILRDLHTLKGSARMVGLIDLNELIQSLEQTFRNIYEAQLEPKLNILDEIQTALDYLNTSIEDKNEALVEYVRVAPEQLEKMSLFASEINVSNRHIEQNIKKMLDEAKETMRNIILLQEQVKQLVVKTDANIKYNDFPLESKKYEEFDFLEMDAYSDLNQESREISEKSSELEYKIEKLVDMLRKTNLNFVEQKRTIKILEESIRRSRLVSVREVLPRLERIVRQVSRELFKDVRLEILKIEGEIDRKILEQLISPLEHMIRNAIDHGIGTPADRILMKKSQQGVISVSFYKRGNEMVIEVTDDGEGIKVDLIKKRAIEKKIWDKDKPMSKIEAYKVILLPGFSTREVATFISGQGVGLDVVNTKVNKLGGVLTVTSEDGVGTKFTIRVPLLLSSNKALVFTVEDVYYALPLSHLVAIKRYAFDQKKTLVLNNKTYHLIYLKNLLGYCKTAQNEKHSSVRSVIFLKSEYKEIAIVVDKLIGSWELLIKPLSFQLQEIKEISGVSFLADEKIVFMLDSTNLTQMLSQLNEEEKLVKGEVNKKSYLVLIVDDSNTVRRVTARILKQQGFESSQVRDGQEALLHMVEHRPDVVLLDLEMPEMDGFEVLEKMRKDPKLKDIPVIVITSRSGDKHRIRAEKLGISGYFTKPYLEEDLLTLVRELLHV